MSRYVRCHLCNTPIAGCKRLSFREEKADSRYKRRKPTVDGDRVRQMKAEGLGPVAIAKELGIGRASVYRALADA
jgi:DNA invertase Pin-like site-specific DNA recombinase